MFSYRHVIVSATTGREMQKHKKNLWIYILENVIDFKLGHCQQKRLKMFMLTKIRCCYFTKIVVAFIQINLE